MKIQQKPWWIGLLSSAAVGPVLRKAGISPDRQAFDRAGHEASIPRIPPVDGPRLLREDVEIPSADGGGTNMARLYTPRSLGEQDRVPLIVYAHGGGWCLNSGLTQPWENICASLCTELGWCVLSVDYRRAPEHPWPAAAEDYYRCLTWLAEAPQVAPSADRSRIVLMGESAGGNLVACASLMWRDRRPTGVTVAHQVLLSPCIPVRPLLPSRTDPARANGAFLPAWLMEYFEVAYAGPRGVEELSSREPYFNPLAAPSLAGLPPLTGLVGGAEVLRDEGLAYFKAVGEAGVLAEWREVEGGFHAFVILPLGDAPGSWAWVRERLQADVALASSSQT